MIRFSLDVGSVKKITVKARGEQRSQQVHRFREVTALTMTWRQDCRWKYRCEPRLKTVIAVLVVYCIPLQRRGPISRNCVCSSGLFAFHTISSRKSTSYRPLLNPLGFSLYLSLKLCEGAQSIGAFSISRTEGSCSYYILDSTERNSTLT